MKTIYKILLFIVAGLIGAAAGVLFKIESLQSIIIFATIFLGFASLVAYSFSGNQEQGL